MRDEGSLQGHPGLAVCLSTLSGSLLDIFDRDASLTPTPNALDVISVLVAAWLPCTATDRMRRVSMQSLAHAARCCVRYGANPHDAAGCGLCTSDKDIVSTIVIMYPSKIDATKRAHHFSVFVLFCEFASRIQYSGTLRRPRPREPHSFFVSYCNRIYFVSLDFMWRVCLCDFVGRVRISENQ